jgi:hypothetical protein
MNQFIQELLDTVEEGLDVRFRKGYFSHDLVIRVSDYSKEPSLHFETTVSTDQRFKLETDKMLAAHLKRAKTKVLKAP